MSETNKSGEPRGSLLDQIRAELAANRHDDIQGAPGMRPLPPEAEAMRSHLCSMHGIEPHEVEIERRIFMRVYDQGRCIDVRNLADQ